MPKATINAEIADDRDRNREAAPVYGVTFDPLPLPPKPPMMMLPMPLPLPVAAALGRETVDVPPTMSWPAVLSETGIEELPLAAMLAAGPPGVSVVDGSMTWAALAVRGEPAIFVMSGGGAAAGALAHVCLQPRSPLL